MDIKEVSLLRFTNSLLKRPQVVVSLHDAKKSAGSGVTTLTNNKVKQNLRLTEKIQKPIIRSCKKGTVCSRFKGNIWGSDLADMQSISKFNKGTRFLLRFIDAFSEYVWVAPLKDKKGVTIISALQKVLDKSTRKPNKIWVGKGSEF